MVVLNHKYLLEKFENNDARLRGQIELDLRGMDIEKIEPGTFTNVPNLVYLWLSDNRIESLDQNTFHGLNYLSRLALHNNQIKHLSANTFAPLAELTRLSLANNRIESIEPKALHGLRHLEFVSLNNNRLDEIGPSVFADLDRASVRVVSIYGNTSSFKSFIRGNHLEDGNERAMTQWERDVMRATSVFDFDEFLSQFLGRNSFQSL